MAEQKNFINVKIAVIVCKRKNAVSAKGTVNYLNEELTKFHKEVLCNLNSIHGALAAYEPKYPVGRCKTALSVEQVIYQSSQKRIKSLEFRNCDDLLWF